MERRSVRVISETFGDLLRRFRYAAAISQAELALRSGVSVDGIGALERGTRKAPVRETLVLLADALSLSEVDRSKFEEAAERGRARTSGGGSAVTDAKHNLPSYLTSFIGRPSEVAEIIRLTEENRLVSVTGSGGVGKTRTVVEATSLLVARDGVEVRFVELAPLNDGALIVTKIASVVDIRLSGAYDADSLAAALKTRHVRLIFDTCEHLLSATTSIARTLLQRCPNVRILVTSRERLGIVGEVVQRLAPLAIPDDVALKTVADARSYAALELFIERALWANPDLTFAEQQVASTIDICRRLEGIPLAIELAVARLATMTIETLARRLKEDLAAASRVHGLPDRQQTMQNTIAWSHQLLDQQERVLFRRLAVFAGGCTLAAAEAVCAGDGFGEPLIAGCLASLVDKSLVDPVLVGERMRYALLDSTHAFARERLSEAGESDTLSRRHAQWLAMYGETALSEYLSKSNFAWLADFRPELNNVRTALEWALESSNDDILTAGQIAGRYRGLWLIPGYFDECRRWIEPILSRIDEIEHPLVVVSLLQALSATLVGTKSVIVRDHLSRVLRRVGDRRLLVTHLAFVAIGYCQLGLYSQADDTINEVRSLLGETGVEPISISDIALLMADSDVSISRKQFERARRCLDEAVSRSDGLNDKALSIYLTASYAELDFSAGDGELAAKGFEGAVERATRLTLSTTPLSYVLWRLACCLLNVSDFDGAVAAAQRSLMLPSSRSDDEVLHLSLHVLAAVAALRGHIHSAARLGGYVEAWCSAVGYWRRPIAEVPHRLLTSTLQSQLSSDVIGALNNEGAAFTVDDAFEEARSAMMLDAIEP